MDGLPKKLLAADEPAPVMVHNAGGTSPFLLVADHAGHVIPRRLGGLGVTAAERQRHIAWPAKGTATKSPKLPPPDCW